MSTEAKIDLNAEKLSRLKEKWDHSHGPIIDCNKYNYISKDNNFLFYQYRSFANLWKILDSDVLWARNIKFSNDAQEQDLGRKLLKRYIDDKKDRERDYYMICFSENGDLLSQWRGYANKGGVAIGFEFNSVEPFQLIADDSDNKPNSKDYINVFVRPCKVLYVDKKGKIYHDNTRTRGKSINNIKDVVSAKEDHEYYYYNPSALVPFIKNYGFIEENEWRIIFNEGIGGTDIDERTNFRNFVHYETEQNSTSRKIPYIVVKSGFKEFEGLDPLVRLQIEDIPQYSDFINKLANSGVRLLKCWENKIKEACYGCTQVLDMPICIDTDASKKAKKLLKLNKCCGRLDDNRAYYKSNSQIVISQGKQQKEVFEKVYELLSKEKLNKEIKVWCEGHLPIRKIVIGPCENQKEMEYSIKAYFNKADKYWLRDVEVSCSDLPYRVPRD